MFLFLADLVLVTHALFVAFVVLGLVLIPPGTHWHWNWIRNRRFRTIHAAAIGFVVAEAWLGWVCPLTEWENRLREAGGGAPYDRAFIQHWVQELLFYDFAPWIFAAAYTAFGVLVLVAWLLVPPEPRGGRKSEE